MRSHFAYTQCDRINTYIQPKPTYAIPLKLRTHLFHALKLADFIPPSPSFRSLSSNCLELWSLGKVNKDGN
ncbi:MAG TPA: hypothetical protein V6C93_10480 [Allocoleopsis sp.]